MSRSDPYAGSSYRISKKEWDELNAFFITIDRPAQNELYASGDHYTLYLRLLNLGFRPPSDAMEIYEMAEQILLLGYES
jgi:hypothetical protein